MLAIEVFESDAQGFLYAFVAGVTTALFFIAPFMVIALTITTILEGIRLARNKVKDTSKSIRFMIGNIIGVVFFGILALLS